MEEALARIQLMGPFKIFLTDGQDATPSSARACAIIAMLATAENHEHSRKWLESILWSKRNPEQASGSLRQALTRIRKIGQMTSIQADVLVSDRQTVALTPGIFTIQDFNAFFASDAESFLEGMHIRDEAFQAWREGFIEQLKQTLRPVPNLTMSPASRLLVECAGKRTSQQTDACEEVVLANYSALKLGQSVAETVGADCIVKADESENPKSSMSNADFRINCHIVRDNDANHLLVDIKSCHTDKLIYSDDIKLAANLPFNDNGIDFHRLSFDAGEAVLENAVRTMPVGDPRSAARDFQHRAIREIFRFDKASMMNADHYLDLAYSLEPNAVFLAWKALIRTIQAIELFETDIDTLKSQAQTLVEQCMLEGANNPLVLSLIALVQVMLFDDEEFAIDLATPALKKNPSSAFALQAMAASRMVFGDNETAYEQSQRSRAIAQGSAFRHWWDLYHCLACTASARFAEALKMAELASRRSPRFRPPLRQMISLYTHFGEPEKALDAARRLALIEPDFCIENFVSNFDYPNRTLRNAGLLDLDYEHLREFGT